MTREWLLPPNLISAARILMTPVIAWRLAEGDAAGALPWIVAASVSDALDGFLARGFRWSSELGQKLDPAADKLMLVAVYLSLAIGGMIPRWMAALVVGRDVMIVAFAAWAARRIPLTAYKPTAWGKLSTILQMTYAAVVVGSAVWAGSGLRMLCEPLMWAAAAGTLVSGMDYARIGRQLLSGAWRDQGD